MVVTVWVVGGLLSLAGALTYAELAAMMPRAGGEYVFITEAYGRLPGFLYGWTRFFVASTGGVAGLAAGFAIFLNIVAGGAVDLPWLATADRRTRDRVDRPPGRRRRGHRHRHAGQLRRGGGERPHRDGAHGSQDRAGARASARRRASLAHGHWSHFALSAAGSACDGVAAAARGGVAGFGAAMLGAMWAYNGWNEITYVSEEVKDPQRNLPLAIIGGIGIVAVALHRRQRDLFLRPRRRPRSPACPPRRRSPRRSSRGRSARRRRA